MQLLEIQLLTNNLEKTESFYSGLLEFPVIRSGSGTVSYQAGASVLSFVLLEQTDATYHFAFNIPCNQLEEAIGWLSSKVRLLPVSGGEVIADFKNWNAKSVYFYDDLGNILEFIARFDLQQTSTSPFIGTSVQCISEIGIVVDEPLPFTEKLLREHGIRDYKKGPKGPDFSVMGDEDGLFIISKKNRHWYPTDTTALPYDLVIRYAMGKTERTLMLKT